MFANQKDPAKKARIYDSFSSFMTDRSLYVLCETMENLEDMLEEFREFPDSTHMDHLDAIAMGADILNRNRGRTGAVHSGTMNIDMMIPQGIKGAILGRTFRME